MKSTKLTEVLTAEEYCAKRDEIVALLTQAVEKLGEAESLLCTVANYGFSFDRNTFYGVNDPGRRLKSIRDLTKQVDRKMWDRVIELGKFRELMTVNEQRKIADHLEQCPPLTIESVKATLATLMANRPNMLQDLVQTAFLERDKKYKSNAGMGISRRQVINNVFDRYGFRSWGSRAADRLDDICKALSIITGVEKPHVLQKLERDTEITDFGGVRFKAFQNGNVHIFIEDKAILNKLNDVLAGSFGSKVGNI